MFGSPLILGAAPAGLALGALAWLSLAHGAAAHARINAPQTRADAISAPPDPPLQLTAGASAASAPIFALTTGPGAVTQTQVELLGIARMPSQTSALIAINGKPAQWLTLGETRDDVTLDDVQADKVTVDTPTGSMDVVLGAKPAAPNGTPNPTTSAAPTTSAPPPGFHLPPPPASAPGR